MEQRWQFKYRPQTYEVQRSSGLYDKVEYISGAISRNISTAINTFVTGRKGCYEKLLKLSGMINKDKSLQDQFNEQIKTLSRINYIKL